MGAGKKILVTFIQNVWGQNYLSCHFHGLQGYYSLVNLRITGTGGNIEKHEQPLTFVELSRQNDKAIELIRMETSV